MKTHYIFTLSLLSSFFNTVIIAQTNTPCASGSVVAPALTVGASCSYTSGTTVGATSQTNLANAGSPSCGLMGPDVWYSFVAPASGSVVIQTQAGSISDGVMALYSGSCGSWTQIACDDESGAGSMPQISSASLVPGDTYLVRFWEWAGGTGTFDICITQAAGGPTNVTCSVPTPVCSGSPISFVANSGGAAASTLNPGNDYDCLFTSPNPSWYYLEIAQSGNLIIDITAGSDVDYEIWGPFGSLANAIANCNSYGTPEDCSYSSSAIEQAVVNGVSVGQVHVLLVTNYANTVQTININEAAANTAATNCAIVLPVGFTQWNATSANGQVRLNWSTESESENDYFAVQRSADGLIWETLGFTDGNGSTSEVHHYGYTDHKPNEGINYYRLMQVDFNGGIQFSTILSVDFVSSSAINVYPNPAKGTVNVRNFDKQINRVVLVDNIGRSILPQFIGTENGVAVDCSCTQKGTYILQCTDEGGNTYSSLLTIE